MFNWFYAAIGVALGIAGGVFRGVIVNLCILGFLFFSATFGLQWAATTSRSAFREASAY